MPGRKASGYPAEWVKKAQEDFRRVARRLAEEDVEDAAFHLQQALEKLLKGYLLSSGWQLKKTHDLEALPMGSPKGLHQAAALPNGTVTAYGALNQLTLVSSLRGAGGAEAISSPQKLEQN